MLVHAHRQARRSFGSARWRPQRYTSSSITATKDSLRRLLRETAQQVAVVTSFYPLDGLNDQRPFHGATLSSFSSIALDPYPLVSFSLRIPSRMATSLKESMTQQEASAKPSLVINILSSAQANTAHHFARADLFPDPFRITPHTLTEEGLPVLSGALGALSCDLVTCMPLHTLCDRKSEPGEDTEGVISELFISRVARVEDTGIQADTLPLVYHRRRYATVLPFGKNRLTDT